MQTDYSLFIGPDGRIARSGKTIYDLLHEGHGHLLPSIQPVSYTHLTLPTIYSV